MSRIYDALKKLEAERERVPPSRPVALDLIRVEQFLDLQRDLLIATQDPETLPDRLVHAVATFLGVPGAAVGVVQGNIYRVLATYGLTGDVAARHDGSALQDSELTPALTHGRPLVLRDLRKGATLRELVLPFRGKTAGALHLVVSGDATVSDEDVGLARALTGLVGAALGSAAR